jgi:HTH-type transcriptional regulator/antitoxin HigA
MILSYQIPKAPIEALILQVPYLNEITCVDEYEQALELVEALFDDYESNRFLIDVLSLRVAEWESKADEFKSFNEDLAKLESGVPLLTILIEQYQLKMADLKDEIGSKSLISQILHGKRSLTKQHIEKLSQRFHLSPAAFFS